jgi:AcrR family transcriptional regulator
VRHDEFGHDRQLDDPAMSVPGAPVRQRVGGRSARIAQQVHDAIRQLLIEGDPESITIAAIAERSGVHFSTIYRRWGDVGTLQLEVALEIAAGQMPTVDTGSLAIDLLSHARHAVVFAQSVAGGLLIKGLLDVAPEQRRWYWEHRFAAIRVPFDRAIARREIAADSPVVDALVNLTGSLYFRLLFSGDQIDIEQTARAIVEVALLTVGLAPPHNWKSTNAK